MIKLNYENSSIKENVILNYVDDVEKIHKNMKQNNVRFIDIRLRKAYTGQ